LNAYLSQAFLSLAVEVFFLRKRLYLKVLEQIL